MDFVSHGLGVRLRSAEEPIEFRAGIRHRHGAGPVIIRGLVRHGYTGSVAETRFQAWHTPGIDHPSLCPSPLQLHP